MFHFCIKKSTTWALYLIKKLTAFLFLFEFFWEFKRYFFKIKNKFVIHLFFINLTFQETEKKLLRPLKNQDTQQIPLAMSAKSTKGLNHGIPVYTEERANIKRNNQNVISPDLPRVYLDNDFIITKLEVFKRNKDDFFQYWNQIIHMLFNFILFIDFVSKELKKIKSRIILTIYCLK